MIEQLDLKQKLFITHTYIYYELNDSVISDHEYDERANELFSSMKLKEWRHTKYKDLFKGFNPCTGYNLVNKEDKGNYEFFLRQARNTLEAHQDYIDML